MAVQSWKHGGDWYIRHAEIAGSGINLNTAPGAAFVLRKLDELAVLKDEKEMLKDELPRPQTQKPARSRGRKPGPKENK